MRQKISELKQNLHDDGNNDENAIALADMPPDYPFAPSSSSSRSTFEPAAYSLPSSSSPLSRSTPLNVERTTIKFEPTPILLSNGKYLCTAIFCIDSDSDIEPPSPPSPPSPPPPPSSPLAPMRFKSEGFASPTQELSSTSQKVISLRSRSLYLILFSCVRHRNG